MAEHRASLLKQLLELDSSLDARREHLARAEEGLVQAERRLADLRAALEDLRIQVTADVLAELEGGRSNELARKNALEAAMLRDPAAQEIRRNIRAAEGSLDQAKVEIGAARAAWSAQRFHLRVVKIAARLYH